jgi:hypothetical protein
MPNHSHEAKVSGAHLLSCLALVVVAIAAVVIVAIFFRPGGFNVEAQGQGVTIKLAFDDSRVDLSEFLGQLLKKAESGTNADQRLVSSILQAHGFYRIPSPEAAAEFRGIKETETTRDFVRAVRSTLYDLDGPFSRPATFLEADDRVVDAIDDLYQQKPTSPVVIKLWEMSLDMKGIFEPRDIKVSIREDASLVSGVAATCAGNIWFGRVGLIRMGEEARVIGPRIEVSRPCGSADNDPHADRKARVWLSTSDMHQLIGNETSGSGGEVHAILTPLPKNLAPEGSGQ